MKRLLVVILILVLVAPVVNAQDQEEVTLFVSFIPSVQFAPIYVAIENGYFAEEGIDLEVEHSFNEIDGVDRIALNDLQFGMISGEQVIIGRSAEKPLVYVYEWYHAFPVGIVAPADSDITEPADLRDKVVGIPGPFGATYIGLQALLGISDIDPLELTLESIGFTAPENICAGTVDAAAVYIVNEPLTIAENCFDVTVIPISDYAEDLVSNGLVTNETTIENNPELVAGMARALARGVAFTLENPDEAFELSLAYVPDLPEEEYETQRQVLQNSLPLWDSERLGFSDPIRWETTQEVLIAAELLRDPLDDLEAAFTNDFVPE